MSVHTIAKDTIVLSREAFLRAIEPFVIYAQTINKNKENSIVIFNILSIDRSIDILWTYNDSYFHYVSKENISPEGRDIFYNFALGFFDFNALYCFLKNNEQEYIKFNFSKRCEDNKVIANEVTLSSEIELTTGFKDREDYDFKYYTEKMNALREIALKEDHVCSFRRGWFVDVLEGLVAFTCNNNVTKNLIIFEMDGRIWASDGNKLAIRHGGIKIPFAINKEEALAITKLYLSLPHIDSVYDESFIVYGEDGLFLKTNVDNFIVLLPLNSKQWPPIDLETCTMLYLVRKGIIEYRFSFSMDNDSVHRALLCIEEINHMKTIENISIVLNEHGVFLSFGEKPNSVELKIDTRNYTNGQYEFVIGYEDFRDFVFAHTSSYIDFYVYAINKDKFLDEKNNVYDEDLHRIAVIHGVSKDLDTFSFARVEELNKNKAFEK